MPRLLLIVAVLAAAAGVGLWFLSAPRPLAAAALPPHTPDLKNGEATFWAGGCASCHADPKAQGADKLKLGGGLALKTPFGTFVAPNISPDRQDGIGAWSTLDFVNAVIRGVSPEGRHYYPAFPYTSYQRMRLEDVIDLKAYLDTLPPVQGRAPGHELGFPYSIRRGLGLWKLLYLDGTPFQPDPAQSPQVNRGAYLVQGPGHCAECHTPRDVFGGLDRSRDYAGGPSPEGGQGRIPNITPDRSGLGPWSAADIAEFLTSGLTPDGDVVGGSMARVVDNTAKLTAADREAIAAYLKSLPPRPTVRN